MSIAEELKELASKLEKEACQLLDNVDDDRLNEEVLTIIAHNSLNLEKLASFVEEVEGLSGLKPEDLDQLCAMADEFDKSSDPELRKQAAVLDEILLTIGAPKNALAESLKKNEDEINKLREKYRHDAIDKLYKKPKEALDKGNMVEEQSKAVKEQVKRYRPLEAPLQTRYSPDIPGEMLMRISDHVYQSALTGKIYDYRAGYTTDKGNQIPGTSVEFQTPELGGAQSGRSLFDTRENVMSRYASNIDEVFKALRK